MRPPGGPDAFAPRRYRRLKLPAGGTVGPTICPEARGAGNLVSPGSHTHRALAWPTGQVDAVMPLRYNAIYRDSSNTGRYVTTCSTYQPIVFTIGAVPALPSLR